MDHTIKTDMNKLRRKMADRKMTRNKLANYMGINPSTFSRKMKSNGLSFSVKEMQKIVEALDLTGEDIIQIFLTP